MEIEKSVKRQISKFSRIKYLFERGLNSRKNKTCWKTNIMPGIGILIDFLTIKTTNTIEKRIRYLR
jgi:hypothetical protein